MRFSVPMRRVLENLAMGRPSTYGFPGGRSQSGGLGGTFLALRRRGLIDIKGQITDEGRRALQEQSDG